LPRFNRRVQFRKPLGEPWVSNDIQVITAPTLRLDLEADRRSLAQTIDHIRPRLLILDPFVRLHRIDENARFCRVSTGACSSANLG
jgi:hypothetical protein